jgi:hypothetical protein
MADRVDPPRVLDYIVIFGEAHLRRILRSYYYNRASEHPSVYVVEEKRLC